MGTLYTMISTRASEHYTGPAISSFLKYTKLNKDDRFILIDNDNTGNFKDVEVVNNLEPKSFAANINYAITEANGLDVVILSNDIEFTPGWADPLSSYSNAILLPSCNQTHQYVSRDNSLALGHTVTLEEYNNNRPALLDIVRQHRQSVKPGFFERYSMPLYVFTIPYKIYSKVGLFDETFGIAGGEDVDYRLRAIDAGFSVKYISTSYLLHFHGKSTWSGAETQSETTARDNIYRQRFIEKWGGDWALLFLSGTPVEVIYNLLEKHNLLSYVDRGDFTGMIKHILKIQKIVDLSN